MWCQQVTELKAKPLTRRFGQSPITYIKGNKRKCMLSHSARNIPVLVHLSPSPSVVFSHSRQKLSEKSLWMKNLLYTTGSAPSWKDNVAPYLLDYDLKKLIKCQWCVVSVKCLQFSTLLRATYRLFSWTSSENVFRITWKTLLFTHGNFNQLTFFPCHIMS